MSGVLEILEEIGEAAAQNGSGGRAAEQTAQSAGQAPQAVIGAPATEEPAQNVAKPSARSRRAGNRRVPATLRSGLSTAQNATAFHGLVGKDSENGHGHRGHAAPGGWLRLALAARAVQHAIDDIEKSHIPLLNVPNLQRSRPSRSKASENQYARAS